MRVQAVGGNRKREAEPNVTHRGPPLARPHRRDDMILIGFSILRTAHAESVVQLAPEGVGTLYLTRGFGTAAVLVEERSHQMP